MGDENLPHKLDTLRRFWWLLAALDAKQTILAARVEI